MSLLCSPSPRSESNYKDTSLYGHRPSPWSLVLVPTQRLSPLLQEHSQLFRRTQPDIGSRLTRFMPHQHANMRRFSLVDSTERRFVGEVISEIRHRLVPPSLLDNRLNGAALVAAYAQLNPRFKIQQREPIHLRERVKQLARLALDAKCLLMRMTAPMHHRRIGLVFKQAAKCIATQLFAHSIKFFARSFGWLFQLLPAIEIEPLRSVQPPHFNRSSKPQHRGYLARGPACNHCHVRATLPLNILKQ